MRTMREFAITAGTITVCSLLIEGITLPDSFGLAALEPAYPAIKAAVAKGDCRLASLQGKPIPYTGARDAFRLNRQAGETVLHVDGVQVDTGTDGVSYRFSVQDKATGKQYSGSAAEVRSHLCANAIAGMLNSKLAN